MNLEIITNHIPRPLIYGFDLTEKERANFDYYTDEELDSCIFFRYKNQIYDIAEFTRCNCDELKDWHGVKGDSFFSGVLIKLHDSGDAVTVGRYYS